MTTAIDELLLSAAEVEIQATGKPPAVTILAYTGGLMTVPGWGPVAIDLAGVDASADQIGILADHDASLKGIVGHGRAVVANGKLLVQGTIKRVLRGDHATTGQAIDAFVKSVLAPAKGAKQTPDAQRELEQLDRRIKTTVGMLADLTFEGFDDLHKVLADLKAKRDALLARMSATQQPEKPALSERQLRSWAHEQFDRLDELAERATVDLKDRQLVEAFVQRIEVFPDTKTGIVVLQADLESAIQSCSTRVVGGDDRQKEGTWLKMTKAMS